MLTTLLLLALVPAALAVYDDSVVDPNVELVIVGMRHGYRNLCPPALDDDPNGDLAAGLWNIEGQCQLNIIGKKQAYALGRLLRHRYADFLGEDVDSVIEGMTSTANRTQETLLYAVAGLKGERFDEFMHSDFPYVIDDHTLQLHHVKDCPVQVGRIWAMLAAEDLSSFDDIYEKYADLIDYVSESTGKKATITDMGLIADQLWILKTYGATQFDWVLNSADKFGSVEEFWDQMTFFPERMAYQCSNFPPCRNAFVGRWLWHVAELLRKKQAGQLDLKMKLFASHSFYNLGMFRAFGDMYDGEDKVETSSGWIVEFRLNPDTQEPELQFFVHKTDGLPSCETANKREFYSVSDCDGSPWCPFDDIMARLETIEAPSLEDHCDADNPDNQIPFTD